MTVIDGTQAFVRHSFPSARAWEGLNHSPYWIPRDEVAAAVLLPNCTEEVAESICERLCDGAEVRDLRHLHSAVNCHAAKKNDEWVEAAASLARALDMPEGRPFAKYVEQVRDLRDSSSNLIHLGNNSWIHRDDIGLMRDALTDLCCVLDLALGVDTEGRTYEDRSAAYEAAISALKADNERLKVAAEHAATRERGELADFVGALSKSRAAYNKGCADTVAAFRKALGDA